MTPAFKLLCFHCGLIFSNNVLNWKKISWMLETALHWPLAQQHRELSVAKYLDVHPPSSAGPSRRPSREWRLCWPQGCAGATRPWIRARMPARREKFHALVSCHCSAAWSPDKPRAGRAVSVLHSLCLSLSLSASHLLFFFAFFFFAFHLDSVFFALQDSPTTLSLFCHFWFSLFFCFLSLLLPYVFLSPTQPDALSPSLFLMITEESRHPDKSFVLMATAKWPDSFFHNGKLRQGQGARPNQLQALLKASCYLSCKLNLSSPLLRRIQNIPFVYHKCKPTPVTRFMATHLSSAWSIDWQLLDSELSALPKGSSIWQT